MGAFWHTVDDLLVIETIAFVAMFVAAVMASAGIYQLIKNRKKLGASGGSKQEQELSNTIRGRVIEFYVPENIRSNRQSHARLRSQLPASQREQRG